MRASLPDGRQVDFTYDALGRRVEKSVSRPIRESSGPGPNALVASGCTTFVWAKDTLVHEVASDALSASERMRTYCFDARGAAFAEAETVLGGSGANIAADAWLFHVNDSTSRPVKLINARGEVCSDIVWSAWGHARAACLKQRFDDEGLALSTTENGERVDPCAQCGVMIEKLGIGGSVIGAKGKKGQYGVYRKK